MKKLGLLALLATFSLTTLAQDANYGAIAFRFDDNQPLSKWKEMAEVFQKHDAVFSMSLNTDAIRHDKKYIQEICRLQSLGMEVMDHTPPHHPFNMSAEHLDIAKDAKIHHQTENRLYLDYLYKPVTPNKTLSITVEDNQLSIPPELVKRSQVLVDIGGELFWLQQDKDKQHFQIFSFWNENNVDLKGKKKLDIIVREKGKDCHPYPENFRFLMRIAQRNFREMGFQPPKSWIHPGGRMVTFMAEDLADLLAEGGYISAATGWCPWQKFTCTPNWKLERYRMNWYDFSLERKNVAEAKALLASCFAKRRLIIVESHMQGHIVPGGWSEYLKRHDELLAWLRQNHVPILTQAQMSETFYRDGMHITGNLLPKLDRDIDEDGQPDGWAPGKDVTFSQNAIRFSQNGNVFQIAGLGGATEGKWHLSAKLDLPANATVTFTVTAFDRN
ncbi:MAG: hypothetical protein IJJ26_08740, partial [Victivallales bacterium]|nr:hypothetical protein [Victivallales bacterium]